jgi:hypothetical protein
MVLCSSKVDDCASAVFILKSMTAHRLFPKSQEFKKIYWPISCIALHILLLVIPHALEVLLEMLAIDSYWELHPIQLF